MDTAMLISTITAAVLAGLTLIATIWLGRRNEKIAKNGAREAELSNQIATERSIVEWHVYRASEENAGIFRIINVGQDTAYDVTVEAWDSRNLARASAAALDPTQSGGTVVFLEVKLEHRATHGPDLDAARNALPERIPRPQDLPFENPIRDWGDRAYADQLSQVVHQQVQIEITWRSKLGRWSHATMHTG
jgi:hypothetical protein